MTIPWRRIKSEYLAGETPSKLAKKYGVKVKTIHEKVSRAKWSQEKARIDKLADEKIVNAIVENTVEVAKMIRQRHGLFLFKCFEVFQKRINNLFEKPQSLENINILRKEFLIIKDIIDLERKNIDIDNIVFGSYTQADQIADAIKEFMDMNAENNKEV